MPSDNIERAIKRASGGGEASDLIDVTLEGYGPNGVAVLVKALTDNRNRTIQDVRRIFMRHGGSLGESGCVSWMFKSEGVINVEGGGPEAEELALHAIDAGAEDVNTEGEYIEIHTQPQDLEEVRRAIEKEAHVLSAEVALVPESVIFLGEKEAVRILNFLDQLEELDDVQHVFSNVDFSDDTLAQLHSQA